MEAIGSRLDALEIETRLDNPYFDRFTDIMGPQDPSKPWYERVSVSQMTHSMNAYAEREKLVAQYAWAVPNDAAIKALVDHSPLIELGAGSGYWARLIAQAGGDIVCYDATPPTVEGHDNIYFAMRDQDGRFTRSVAASYFAVRRGKYAPLKHHPGRTLFLCWPPYSGKLAFNALKQYQGETLLFIGEHDDGCTGDSRFWRRIAREWRLDYTVDIPQWYGIHDDLQVYRRLAQKP